MLWYFLDPRTSTAPESTYLTITDNDIQTCIESNEDVSIAYVTHEDENV